MTTPLTPLMEWDSQEAFKGDVIWWNRLDGRYQIEVRRTEADAPFPGWLCIFDHSSGDKLVFEQGVNLIAGAIFGPDVSDVALWQQMALDYADRAAATPDEREDQTCPRCGEVCSYDGWDHVHRNGLGIGSCSTDMK